MLTCPNCGEENPERFRLCGFCGTPLTPPVAPAQVRKTVTIVFTDLKGSTPLAERLDTESLREVLARYFGEMKSVVQRHGGSVEKYIGDAIVAVFGLPRLHEDDALRAVRAAAEMKQALVELNKELERTWGVTLVTRTGVNTGEIIAGDVTAGQHLVTGDAVNVAARLEQVAPDDEVLIGGPTLRLVRDAVEVEALEPIALKGKSEPVPAYRLVSVTADEALARHLHTPMVGRDRELSRLRDLFFRAVQDRRCHLVTVVGEAGVGKSRLVHELLNGVTPQAGALRTRCLPYGEGITFWPLIEIVRQAAEIGAEDPPEEARAKLSKLVDDRVHDRLAAVLGLSVETFPVEETFWGARKLLEAVSRHRPVVVVVDDIHWAEPTFLDLLEHLAGSIQDGPVLIACSARHDLLEERPEWATGADNLDRVVLEAMSEEESALVVDNLLDGAEIPEALRARIVKAAEGNPLFVEQMLSMMVDDGVVVRDAGGRWTASTAVTSLSVPPTIFALVSARLDRLGTEERAVVERGSVVGHTFYGSAVSALSPEVLRPTVEHSLAALERKQLIRPDAPDPVDEDTYRFHHIMIRDAAYHGLLKRARIELHEAFAGWLEEAAGTLLEYEEIVGYHLEQAYRYRTAMGTVDDVAVEVGRRAAQRFGAAGGRAFSRGDMRAAANLLERAAALLPADDPVRLALAPDLGEALDAAGRFDRAEEVLTEAIEAAGNLGDRRLEMDARVALLLVQYSTDHQAAAEEVLEQARRAIEVFEAHGDHGALARAWRVIALVHGTACRYGAAEGAVHRAIEHARAALDRRQESHNVSNWAYCALYGPAPVAEAVRLCERLLEDTTGDQRAEALIRCDLAQLYAMEGRFDEARDLYRRGRATLEDLGDQLMAASTVLDSSRVEMLAGAHAAAEAQLRRDLQTLEEMGEKYFLSTVAALLAQAAYLQGDYEEADRFSRMSQEASAEDDVESQALWQRVRAKSLAREGRVEEAEPMVRRAVELIGRTDAPVLQANTRLDLAEVLAVAGRPEEALAEVRAAMHLYERKGAVVWLERARAFADELETAVAGSSVGSAG